VPVRAWAVYGLAALLAVVLARWAITRRPHWISLALVLLLLVPLAWLELRWRAADNAFSAATRALAPGSEGSACQRMLGTFTRAGVEWGYVEYDAAGRPASTAWLSYDACRHLMDWYRSDKTQPTLEQAQAVHVIPHEAAHLNGEKNEAVAECFAVQNVEETALMLGATPAQAAGLARIYWRVAYPLQPSEYRSADCREDGPLDLSPRDAAWP
jgi:hypothetical protein